MNIFKMFFRDETEMSVDVIETWEVRWYSRHGEYLRDTKPEVRLFPSKEGAKSFSNALSDAFKLIKHTSGNSITITKTS